MAEKAAEYKPVHIWAAVAAGIILAVMFIKFCTNSGPVIKDGTTATVQQHDNDSITMAQQAQAYQQQVEALKRRAEQVEKKYAHADSSLRLIILQNKALIKARRSPQVAPTDTSTTIVPQEFIDDCEGCFTQLAKTSDSATAYQQETHALRTLLHAQNAADSQRIVQLESDKLALNKGYNDMRLEAEADAKRLAPRRKVKTGLIGTFGNSLLPNGVGIGLMYEDKKDRNFGLEATFGNRPPAYEAFMYVPFSLK
jgi:hypothetical protein